MTTYIALLRGINVSGKNIIKMVELKQLFINLGYYDVITYIQSGNVLFKSSIKEQQLLEDTIVAAISKHFEYDVNVLVLTKNELTTIFNSNPFLAKDSAMDISKLHLTLLNNEPDLSKKHQIETLVINSDDEFIIHKNSVYLHCPNGQAKTKLTNNLFQKKLNSAATTRNWRTITKLIELSNQ
ncbi:DUF1697 domain-containing protein [Lutibacter flavus]|uniref:Uncharacterized conserved protein, DUF1697 family n=1 Tax=Lutibacter flavus TaxID=691689 RepID=A0A238VV07_9FLAO|nr:DUF1697 domain-containing protein [Lutibacter flavus]SNR38068.1 Uncharacterized conserved protein, DUF1697 family [Lutibacter flavus]